MRFLRNWSLIIARNITAKTLQHSATSWESLTALVLPIFPCSATTSELGARNCQSHPQESCCRRPRSLRGPADLQDYTRGQQTPCPMNPQQPRVSNTVSISRSTTVHTVRLLAHWALQHRQDSQKAQHDAKAGDNLRPLLTGQWVIIVIIIIMALPRRHFHKVALHPPGRPTALRRCPRTVWRKNMSSGLPA